MSIGQATASLPTLDEVRAAAELVYGLMPPTPQYCWPLLCERLGTEVWVKHENHTPIGAFKARTAIVYAEELLKREPGTRGLLAATRGNHGQSVALAAQRKKLECVIVVPHGNSTTKNAAMRAQGAKLIEHGEDYQSSLEHARKLAADLGYQLVPAYHRDIVLGIATYWLELFTAVPEIDVAYVPVGMGSGICSAAAMRNALGLKTKLVGVVADQAPTYALSYQQKKIVEAPATTKLADGLACRLGNDEALGVMLENVDHIVRVTDVEVATAMRAMFTDTHNVVEGAGAASLAGATKESSALRGKRVALIATGGNVDQEVFAQVLSESSTAAQAG
ncbi:MAG TPA: threonine dehydratase [Candidatus Sulfotelmatobacter sp.]|jgi:threonine dehydratase|nr:threonine dehydratase [Candidatus Sulfotelmatobacter sp.]